MFLEYEKELDFSDQTIKSFEDYIDDIKIKNDKLGKVCGDNLNEDSCSEKDEGYKKNYINRFITNLKIIKSELRSNKCLLWKKVSIKFY